MKVPPPTQSGPTIAGFMETALNVLYKYFVVKPIDAAGMLMGLKPAETLRVDIKDLPTVSKGCGDQNEKRADSCKPITGRKRRLAPSESAGSDGEPALKRMPHGKDSLMSTLSAETKPLKMFIIKQKLGCGAEGVVYLVESPDKTVARKKNVDLLKTPDERQADIQRETSILSQLDHPNIIKVHSDNALEKVLDVTEEDVGLDDSESQDYVLISTSEDIAGMQMDVASNSLEKVLPELNHSEKLSVCHQILDAVVYMHSKGIFNYDIKPGNILWLGQRPVLIDFGICGIYKPSVEPVFNDSEAGSTLHYSSPEFICLRESLPWLGKKGNINLNKCISWNLGVSITEIMTGQRLFRDEDLFTPLTGATKDPSKINYQELIDTFFEQNRDQMPEKLEVLIRGLVNPDPDQRLSVDAAKAQLEEMLK